MQAVNQARPCSARSLARALNLPGFCGEPHQTRGGSHTHLPPGVLACECPARMNRSAPRLTELVRLSAIVASRRPCCQAEIIGDLAAFAYEL